MSALMLADWIKAQQPRGTTAKAKTESVFYRNLEEELDVRRAEHSLVTLRTRRDAIDFSSNDFLSLASSGLLRMAFFDELARHPGFQLGSTGSRLLDGNNTYIEAVERELAAFHGAEAAIIVNSGYEANGAIFSAIPRPGDVVVYDELIHASVHDGLKESLALTRMSFRHNDVDDFYQALLSVRESQPMVRRGERSVIISVESVYSMDGDVCPLRELVAAAKDIFPGGNAVFVIDEAHSTGVLGPRGAGLVNALGLEKEIAIRMHTFGKALASSGAVILANDTIRTVLINHARSIIYTTAPSFPMLAGIRAAYSLLKSGMTQQAQDRVQLLVRHFFKHIVAKPVWAQANEMGILNIPLSKDWESREFVTQIVPVWTRQRYNYFLVFHLQLAKFCAFPIDFPVVPKGTSRVRLVFHATNTEAEVEGLAQAIAQWAEEMVDIEKSAKGVRIPTAARQVYSWMSAGENCNGVATANGASGANGFQHLRLTEAA
ncbi:class II aminotransferase/8-amino-7-oxononanoate synthase [Parathielavia appendiculata]|uniref:Class II aminotransferase/8-amino-7-oxononanoate synthase n=1 Tax=Parathielavia appendiculata TaxID=2587402 RepID=A0AAN6TRX2_9PEZI|nr:class II aminotransferase/8-amino-7-oxononanoate synthase [Parathielavia appendiculata]